VDGQNLANARVSLPRTVSSVGQADNRAAATHEDALSGAATGISTYTLLLLNARCLIYRQLRIEVNCADWKMRSFLVIAWPRTLLMISILKRALHIDELVAFQG
jgi:hypothetical protein